jgi:hypothetical protein
VIDAAVEGLKASEPERGLGRSRIRSHPGGPGRELTTYLG